MYEAFLEDCSDPDLWVDPWIDFFRESFKRLSFDTCREFCRCDRYAFDAVDHRQTDPFI